MKTGLGSSLVVVVLFAVPMAATAAVALFDVAHEQVSNMYGYPDFSQARSYLQAAGHTLDATTAPLTLEALQGYDLYVSGTLLQPYTADEIAALQAYVAGGGAVMITHDGGWNADSTVASVNTFLQPYGVTMAGTSTYGNGAVITGFAPHCITTGVNTIGVDYIRELTTIAAPAQDLTLGGPEVLAIWEDAGKVIVMGDDSCWLDPGSGSDYPIDYADNLALLLNIFDCVTGTVRTEVQTWTEVKALFE